MGTACATYSGRVRPSGDHGETGIARGRAHRTRPRRSGADIRAAGDIVVAVASAHDTQVRSVMRRSPAWGATTIWIGSGERPESGMADHVLWLDDPDPRVPATGGFVLFYHLLWELTHVCFEHSGLLQTPRRRVGLRHLQR